MEYIECRKCGRRLPEGQFNWSNKTEGVRQTMCRDCFSEYNRKRYKANKDKIKADVKKYREQNPDKYLDMRLKACLRNPTHKNAYRVVESAINAGAIKKPDRCQICGGVPKKRIEAHHEDYSKPLDVIWCCTSCHDKLDQNRRKALGIPYHSHVKAVKCVETGEIFDSITRAAEHVGRKSNSMSQCLSGKRATCAGLHWEYA